MKAEELMIGDYIKHGFGGIGKVTELSKGIVTVYDKGLDDGEGNCEVNFAENEIQPIPLTPEILEKSDFKKDAFTNLSPDYYFDNDEYSICVNLNSTCDKSKSMWIEKRSSRFTVSIEETRHSLDKRPLYVHQLQHALKLCGIEKTIEL